VLGEVSKRTNDGHSKQKLGSGWPHDQRSSPSLFSLLSTNLVDNSSIRNYDHPLVIEHPFQHWMWYGWNEGGMVEQIFWVIIPPYHQKATVPHVFLLDRSLPHQARRKCWSAVLAPFVPGPVEINGNPPMNNQE
jgi:hypothetical protein